MCWGERGGMLPFKLSSQGVPCSDEVMEKRAQSAASAAYLGGKNISHTLVNKGGNALLNRGKTSFLFHHSLGHLELHVGIISSLATEWSDEQLLKKMRIRRNTYGRKSGICTLTRPLKNLKSAFSTVLTGRLCAKKVMMERYQAELVKKGSISWILPNIYAHYIVCLDMNQPHI